jgi:hypothetical protein
MEFPQACIGPIGVVQALLDGAADVLDFRSMAAMCLHASGLKPVDASQIWRSSLLTVHVNFCGHRSGTPRKPLVLHEHIRPQ